MCHAMGTLRWNFVKIFDTRMGRLNMHDLKIAYLKMTDMKMSDDYSRILTENMHTKARS